jgi:hypothetical protein
VDGGRATVPIIGAAGFAAVLLVLLAGFLAAFFFLGFFFAAFFPTDFFLTAFFFAFFFATLFAFFFAGFFAFFLAITSLHQELKERHTKSVHTGTGHSTPRDKSRGVDFSTRSTREQILVKDVRIELYPAIPYHRRRFLIHGNTAKLIHITPSAECAHLEKVPEENASLESVIEVQPEPVVP